MSCSQFGRIAGKVVQRLGYGSMRLSGPGVWGAPADERDAIELVRAVVQSGVQHIDTADAYGPHITESLICKALHPYPQDLLIATKGGFIRQGPSLWTPCGIPAYLRQCVELSLRRLKLDSIDLYYLHRVDPYIPIEDQVGELSRLRAEGKIKSIGLSKVDFGQIMAASAIAPIEAIQNRFNPIDHKDSSTLIKWCEQTGAAFVPYAPLGSGRCTMPYENDLGIRLPEKESMAAATLAWLLQYSPALFPIPGTSRMDHFHENMGALQLARFPLQMAST